MHLRDHILQNCRHAKCLFFFRFPRLAVAQTLTVKCQDRKKCANILCFCQYIYEILLLLFTWLLEFILEKI